MAPTGTLLCIAWVALIKPLKKENKQTINKVNLLGIIIQSRAGLFKAGLRQPRVSAKFQFRNESLKIKVILFACDVMIWCSIKKRETYPLKCFWTEEYEAQMTKGACSHKFHFLSFMVVAGSWSAKFIMNFGIVSNVVLHVYLQMVPERWEVLIWMDDCEYF